MKRFSLSILFISSILLLFSGCNGGIATPAASGLKVDEKLPKIELTKNGVIAEMNEIAFEWKPINDPNVDGIEIYRGEGDSKDISLIAKIKNRYSTHYLDLDVKPNTKYRYFFRTYRGDVVSQKSKAIVVYSKPPLPSVSWIYVRNTMPKMTKLLWRPHPNRAVEYYIVERKSVEDTKWKRIAKLRGRLRAEYIDTNLKDRYIYRYRVRVQTFDGIVSTPSEIVRAITKPLPPVVTGLKASTNLPKKIELTWDKSNYKDFERYYLYRSKRKNGRYELIAKLYNNHFTDKVDEDGVSYFYKISQKDLDGLESPKNEIVMGSTLPKLMAPIPHDAYFDGRAIHLYWFKVDPRSIVYVIERHAKTGLFDDRVTTYKTNQNKFVDRNLIPGTTYVYRIYAIDKYGILSKPSDEVKIEVKELKVTPQHSQNQNVHSSNGSVEQVSQPPREQETTVAVPVDDLDVDSE